MSTRGNFPTRPIAWRRLIYVFVLISVGLSGADNSIRHFELPAGDADERLRQFAVQAEREIMFPAIPVVGVKTRAVHGDLSPRDALDQMLGGTGLVVVEDIVTGALLIGPPSPTSVPRNTIPSKPHSPDKMKKKNPLALLGAVLGIALGTHSEVIAQNPPPSSTREDSAFATIEGRVLNARSGDYVFRARVTIQGTSEEAFTDYAGNYRLQRVVPGDVTVNVFFTGLSPLKETLHVAAGQTVRRDFELVGSERGLPTDKDVVQLSEVLVGARKEMEGAAIAINEQRFAPNMKNVITVEEFGAVTEGNVAEVIKFLPGVNVSYGAGDASTVSVGGAPAAYTPITVGNFPLAAAASSNTGRVVELEQFSINNIARIEVNHSPTPDSPAAALAGSVNLVTRSAFERSRPLFTGGLYLIGRSTDLGFNKTPGPFEDPMVKIQPSFDFSYIRPVNQRFGFTVSGGHNRQFSRQDQLLPTWRGVSGPSNPAANLPTPTAETPYLTDLLVGGGDKFVTRSNIGFTVDYKLSRFGSLSLSYLFAEFDNEYRNRNLFYLVGGVAPGDYGLSFTHGKAGLGEVRQNINQATKHTVTSMPTLTYRHDGPVWKMDGGVGTSKSKNYYYATKEGFIGGTDARRTGVTVSFDDIAEYKLDAITYTKPGRISVTDAVTGAAVDPKDLDSYALTGASDTTRDSFDRQSNAFFNMSRDVKVLGTTIALKTGLDARRQEREIRRTDPAYTFVGADGRASTSPVAASGSDDAAKIVLGESISERVNQFGYGTIQWMDPQKVLGLLRSNPGYFVENTNNTYRAYANASKAAEEDIVSAYIRGDLKLFNSRLRITAGLRAEQTNIKADGPLNDPTLNYQRNSAGNVLLGADGRPLLIVPTSDALGVSRKTLIERGLHVDKEYLRLFPNVNASFLINDSLVLRAAAYDSIGRPDFNQYAGGVTLPDTSLPPSTGNRISVNNAGIKPWTARSFTARLEYYFGEVGQLSVGGFQRDYENFFGSTTFTPSAEFFSLYGIDPDAYSGYSVATQFNITSTVRTRGYSIDYRQVLSFLPQWARGVQVFANLSAQRVMADSAARNSFDGFSPRNANWGVSLTRPRYNVRLNWSYHARQRFGIMTGTGIAPATYTFAPPRMVFDIQGECSIHRNLSLFANLRNVTNTSDAREIYSPSTPEIARFRSAQSIGTLVTVGVKGSY